MHIAHTHTHTHTHTHKHIARICHTKNVQRNDSNSLTHSLILTLFFHARMSMTGDGAAGGQLLCRAVSQTGSRNRSATRCDCGGEPSTCTQGDGENAGYVLPCRKNRSGRDKDCTAFLLFVYVNFLYHLHKEFHISFRRCSLVDVACSSSSSSQPRSLQHDGGFQQWCV